MNIWFFITVLDLIIAIECVPFFNWLIKNDHIKNGHALATIEFGILRFKTMFGIEYKFSLDDLGYTYDEIANFPDTVYVDYPNEDPEEFLFSEEDNSETARTKLRKMRKTTLIISLVLLPVFALIAVFTMFI